MSSEWTVKRLGDCCQKIGSGATPKGGKDAYLDFGPVRLIRSQNIYNDGFTPSGLAFISEKQAKKLDAVSVQAGDVLLNITGDSVARVCQAPAAFIPARVNQHVAIIRPNQEILDARYLRYYLASPIQQELMLGLASVGATRNALTKGMIEEFRVPCPPIEVQAGVAAVLGSLDDRITLLRETNATLEAIAQALFKSWFIDFDPVRAKMEGRAPEGMDEATAALFPDSFEETELGAVPRGWKLGMLGDVAQTARSQMQPDAMHSALHYVGLEHIPRKCLSLNDWGVAEGLESAKSCFVAGDILFGKLRPYFHKVVVAPMDGVCSTDILVCRSSKPAYYGFVVMQLFSDALVTYADRLSNGAKMPRVNWKDLAAYEITVPAQDVAEAFTSTVQPLLNRIAANVFEAQTLATLRDTLLPRLISGQQRLPEAQIAIERALA